MRSETRRRLTPIASTISNSLSSSSNRSRGFRITGPGSAVRTGIVVGEKDDREVRASESDFAGDVQRA
jgi:hypothetical protein